MPPTPPYIELHTASAFSFLDGASTPEALVARAAELGYPACALLDRDNLSGIPRFHLAAKAAGVRAIVGAELTIRAGGGDASLWKSPHPPRLWRLPVLVESAAGYRALCRLITQMKCGAAKGEGALSLDDLEGETSGLVALVGRAALDTAHYGVGGLIDRTVGVFGGGNVYVELQRHHRRDDLADGQALMALASAYRVPVVATNGVKFAAADERPLFDVLTCVRHGTSLARAGARLAPNAERILKAPAAMAELFRDVPHAVAASRALADRLAYSMTDLGYRFPSYPVPAGETQASFLRKITEVGGCERYRPFHDRARHQIARELDLIERLDLAGYFLIVWDIVNFARQHGILVQGRGSAANSAVCYSLGITAVDPVGMELLFERFLSEERGEWPDIDLDLPSGDRREEVIQYVYRRYGEHGAAMTANVITYRSRSAAREVGKALDLDATFVDRLSKVLSPFEWRDPNESLTRHLRDVGLDPEDGRIRLFADLWTRVQHLPRHLGQHSGGMVMCAGRLDEVVPLEPATMPGRVVMQWDKEDCADMGIVKVDLLGLGMMAVLQDALTIINTEARAAGIETLDLAKLPPDDPTVYRMLQEADTIGIFQVESRAQMATLPRLKPRHFYDIVVEVALIRPGPIVGQMVHPYIKRRNGREVVTYAHPSLEPVLKRTLGVPLFQEQLLRMAMVVAGFTGGEAEELRRAMGFKRSEERMQQIETKLRAGMARNGITNAAADAIVKSIVSFALYGFPESHAASFALIVYASAYLKAHYPAAFYTALLNNQPMGFYHPATLVKDAQRHGVRFTPIDVRRSSWDCRVDDDGTIRVGLRYVRGLREEVGRRIETMPVAGEEGGDAGGHVLKNAAMKDVTPSPARASGVAHPPDVARASGVGAHHDAPHLPAPPVACAKCPNDDPSMIDRVTTASGTRWFCRVCAHDWPTLSERSESKGSERSESKGSERRESKGFRSLEHLIAVTGARRDEVAVLAEIGALNGFGYDRRTALWQIERAVRPTGELFEGLNDEAVWTDGHEVAASVEAADAGGVPVFDPTRATSQPPARSPHEGHVVRSPLAPMTPTERVAADYVGTGLTIGPHPMSLRRRELALRGVLRAIDLSVARAGRRVRIAGAVITRQRPGTAKGFTFLTLEDETGISNVIIRPDVFDGQRRIIVSEPFVIVEGILQQQEGVTSVNAERVVALGGGGVAVVSHDFH